MTPPASAPALTSTLQEQCELGQQQLMRMDYLSAEATLAAAEKLAWEAKDFDTLARLLLPLQEARRQRRQRCGEGIVCLDFLASGPQDQMDVESIVGQIPHGQVLIAGWNSVEPAIRARTLRSERNLYLDVFLAAARQDGSVDVFALLNDTTGLKFAAGELPHGRQRGTAETYAFTMSIWEQLHTPFLNAADAETDPLKKIAGYRRAIEVDYACELAHQMMAEVIARM
jgi:hypothetical protein